MTHMSHISMVFWNMFLSSQVTSSVTSPSSLVTSPGNFSVQHLMTSGSRPSIIQPIVDNSKFTGGLNFSQIRQINSNGTSIGTSSIGSNQPFGTPSQCRLIQQQRNQQFQAQQQAAAVALANDLSLIEPTLPFSTATVFLEP